MRSSFLNLPPAGDRAWIRPGVVWLKRWGDGALGRRPDRAHPGSPVRRRLGGVTDRRGPGGGTGDIAQFFQHRQAPGFLEHTPPEHGRIETRKIWTTTAFNDYLDFPYLGQAFVIERERLNKKSGKRSLEVAFGITSR
ncbi:MAG: hypothetical protein M3436_17985 [Pseudomonadota bacterium]|nr:hypothetical protein [Pseudomonadota bacterium]